MDALKFIFLAEIILYCDAVSCCCLDIHFNAQSAKYDNFMCLDIMCWI